MKRSRPLYLAALIMVNVISWMVIHLSISKFMLNLETRKVSRFKLLYRSYPFEQQGAVWDHMFKIKKWKRRLPESTLIMPESFDQSAMNSTGLETIRTHIDEANRAELTHWISILPVPLFFLWNPRYTWRIHVLYALSSNLPFIITQRYNRPRLEHLYQLKEQKLKRKAGSDE